MGVREPIDLVNKSQVTAVGVVVMSSLSGDRKKIPTRGHYYFSLTTVQSAADSATVKLKGTNNPDESSSGGEDLITNTHVGTDQKDGSSIAKGYKYVFVEVTAEGGGAGADFAAGTGFRLHGTALS